MMRHSGWADEGYGAALRMGLHAAARHNDLPAG
ncbi:hypothetical protein ABH927_004882 [Planotetraspora sp. GP83]